MDERQNPPGKKPRRWLRWLGYAGIWLMANAIVVFAPVSFLLTSSQDERPRVIDADGRDVTPGNWDLVWGNIETIWPCLAVSNVLALVLLIARNRSSRQNSHNPPTS